MSQPDTTPSLALAFEMYRRMVAEGMGVEAEPQPPCDETGGEGVVMGEKRHERAIAENAHGL